MSTPTYRQIADELRRAIEAGELASGASCLLGEDHPATLSYARRFALDQ